MDDPLHIRIAEYSYNLPEDRIAQFPLKERDASKLLVFNNPAIVEDVFSNIANHLPSDSLLVFNDTRVIRARLIFRKPTGAPIEIFCLEPLSPTAELQSAFQQKSGTTWKCLVGNLKRWKAGSLEIFVENDGKPYRFSATRTTDFTDGSVGIRFDWNPPEVFFGKMLEIIGLVPLPPYINRKPDQRDKDRYQTIFAVHDGSVAAPTAGLHFTENVLVKLRDQKIHEQRVTLHVGVGTFRPVACEQIGDHVMHHEKITVTFETIRQLINHSGKPIIAVGTTAARTLESLYWLGQKASMGEVQNPLAVQQWAPYQNNCKAEISTKQALEALLNHLKWHNLDAYSGETQLMIVPGYQFRLISGMVTNFHMPQSTLLLLVAAMIGPKWKDVYQYALDGGYRFLSYGDACLFFTKDNGKNKNQNA